MIILYRSPLVSHDGGDRNLSVPPSTGPCVPSSVGLSVPPSTGPSVPLSAGLSVPHSAGSSVPLSAGPSVLVSADLSVPPIAGSSVAPSAVPLSAGPSMPSGSCPFVPAHAVSSRESSTDIPGLTDSEYGTTICEFHVPEAKPANFSGSAVADVPRIVLGMFN